MCPFCYSYKICSCLSDDGCGQCQMNVGCKCFRYTYILSFSLSVQDYTSVVKDPTDFSIIRQQLDNNLYDDLDSFVRDVRLVFSNSRLYNTNQRSRVSKRKNWTLTTHSPPKTESSCAIQYLQPVKQG